MSSKICNTVYTKPLRGKSPWTTDDDTILLDLAKIHTPLAEIASKLDRSTSAISARLDVLTEKLLNSGKDVTEVAELTGLKIDIVKSMLKLTPIQRGGVYTPRKTDDSLVLPDDYVLLKPKRPTMACRWNKNQDTQLLELVALGYSNAKIAKLLDRTDTTVYNHLINLGKQMVREGVSLVEARDTIGICFKDF
jgi:hypothetical protein